MQSSRQTTVQGFTLVELFVSLCIVVLVALFCLRPTVGPGKASAHRTRCVNNLKNLGLAVRIHAQDNPPRADNAILTNFATATAADCLRALSNELASPKIVRCPSDRRAIEAPNFSRLENVHISYFASRSAKLEKAPGFPFGDRNLSTNGIAVPSGAILRLSATSKLGWTAEMHNNQGNVATADGSVQQFSSNRLQQSVQDAGSEMELLVP